MTLMNTPTFSLVVGTGNVKKLRELQSVLSDLPIELRSLADFSNALDVDETGDTFAANARLKATEQARHLNRWVIADDSGLAVDSLDGAPGIFSARYAGTHGDDKANNQKLLRELDGVSDERRGAAFVCALCVASPDGSVRAESQARCRGRILRSDRGQAGFGYDPLFEIPEYHRTFAELGLAVKKAISHRSIAMRLLKPQLARLVRDAEDVG